MLTSLFKESKIPELGLTPNQKRFIIELLVDLDVGNASLRAGYKSAKYGYDILKLPAAQRFLAFKREELEAKTGITVERVLMEYARIAFFNPKHLYNERNQLRDIQDLPDEVAAAISEFHIDTRQDIPELTKFKAVDKKGALDSLARHLGMFDGKTGAEGQGFTLIIHEDCRPKGLQAVVTDDEDEF